MTVVLKSNCDTVQIKNIHLNVSYSKEKIWYYLSDKTSIEEDDNKQFSLFFSFILTYQRCFIICLCSCFLCSDHLGLWFRFVLIWYPFPFVQAYIFLNVSLSKICFRIMFDFWRSFLVSITRLGYIYNNPEEYNIGTTYHKKKPNEKSGDIKAGYDKIISYLNTF